MVTTRRHFMRRNYADPQARQDAIRNRLRMTVDLPDPFGPRNEDRTLPDGK